MRGRSETDSGSYINGVYTTKNGTTNTQGLACPKGVRLYDPNVVSPLIFFPEDNAEGEDWEFMTDDVAEDILPYYAVSNYGRVMNIRSGKVMKENYRNDYGYYCLAAENSNTGQKKYSTHRLVMKAFQPVENMDELVVNHINGNRRENYINKVMEDGSIKSNLEWATYQENTEHSFTVLTHNMKKLSIEDVKNIRRLHTEEKLSYMEIVERYYPNISHRTIQSICNNKTYYDPDYTPLDPKYYYKEPVKKDGYFKISDDDAKYIRSLNKEKGIKAKDIWRYYYPNVSYSTILDIVSGIAHNR